MNLDEINKELFEDDSIVLVKNYYSSEELSGVGIVSLRDRPPGTAVYYNRIYYPAMSYIFYNEKQVQEFISLIKEIKLYNGLKIGIRLPITKNYTSNMPYCIRMVLIPQNTLIEKSKLFLLIEKFFKEEYEKIKKLNY